MNNRIEGSVYIITFPNIRKYYVGSSKNLHRRILEHKNDLKNNIHHCIPLQDYDETKRKPTCFNRWMNFHNIFGYLK